jgi:tetratricopeptide (TPR) repeat protein
MQGRFDEGRELLARARSNLEELGLPLDIATLAFWSGPLELLARDPASAERELAAACKALEAHGERGRLSTMAAFHAEALYLPGRFEDAEAAVRVSLLAQRREFDEAERLAREAVATIDRSDEVNHHGNVRMGLVEVLRLAGRANEAREVLAEASRATSRRATRL